MRVGIIAALGFLVGTAWPKLTDTRLAPRPPGIAREAKTASAKSVHGHRGTHAHSTSPSKAPHGGGLAAEGASQPPGTSAKTPAPTTDQARSKPATAKVVIETAKVRHAPASKTVVAKLSRGEEVRVVARKGKWLRVRFGEGLRQEGWIFGKSVGR